MDAARSPRRRFLALGAVIAAIAVLLAGIGVAAVIAIRSGIHDATVAPHEELTEQFNAIDLPDDFTLVRTEKGGSVWNLPLGGTAPGPFEIRVFEIERDSADAYRTLTAGLKAQGFEVQRLLSCYLIARSNPVELTVEFYPTGSASRGRGCPGEGWPRAFAVVTLSPL